MKVTRIHVSCHQDKYDVNVYHRDGSKKSYTLSADSIVFDKLSDMSNYGKVRTYMQLSVYPTLSFTPKEV